MDLRHVLRRIDIWLAEHPDSSDAELSTAATGSDSTIRNWRRRVEKEQAPGATVSKVEAIAAVMGRPTRWLQGEGPDDFAAFQIERAELLRLFEELPSEEWRELALQSVRGVAATASAAARASTAVQKARKHNQ